MTQEEIVTALMGEWEVPCALCDVLPAAADLVESQQREIETLRNELCQYCGKYKRAHEGACNGCRWKQ